MFRSRTMCIIKHTSLVYDLSLTPTRKRLEFKDTLLKVVHFPSKEVKYCLLLLLDLNCLFQTAMIKITKETS